MNDGTYDQAQLQVDDIVILVSAYNDDPSDETMEAIDENALEVSVRSGWHSRFTDAPDEEFRIVLCTGGPHVEIRGELDGAGTPVSADIYAWGWGESQERFRLSEEERVAVLDYAQILIGG